MRGIKNGNKITYIKGVFFAFIFFFMNIRVCVRRGGAGGMSLWEEPVV